MSSEKEKVVLEEVVREGQAFYKITNSDQMRPFLMTIVSAYNHWMFISSNGGLSAGRQNADHALFPYYTDDKITELADISGSKSIFRVSTSNGEAEVWEPFSYRYEGRHEVSRHLYKSIYGNRVILEEVNLSLGLTFAYQWAPSKEYGFIRTAMLSNQGKTKARIEFIDGIQNIMPYGVGSDLQNSLSNLVDAYKRSELDTKTGIGIYALSAIIVDRAEPSEALKANIVWSLGLNTPTHLLSARQLPAFRKGHKIEGESDVKAEKGAYLLHDQVTLDPTKATKWYIVADVTQTQSKIAQLQKTISNNDISPAELEKSITSGTQDLIKLNAGADGLQLTADSKEDARHFSNVLFNIMRGGIMDNNYLIGKADFLNYLERSNKVVYRDYSEAINSLSDSFTSSQLIEKCQGINDIALQRLAKEYLPLKFSRRHGDPSRPWNKFSINTQDEQGEKVLDYQGNWRDIFQNWEALAFSYPGFIESMIHRFLNASTFDGYNPYRVLKYGFDWEAIEPHDPWSYIGYWGDHQIIYLLKLLEFCEDVYPGKLKELLDTDIFAYANVPYKIKTYQEILKNPKDTVIFDQEEDSQIRKSREDIGTDGALLTNQKGSIHTVNFLEKLLATSLAKISNFIPDGGIWLNTQRPEWNDANNALVGNGVSMVTLYYLRRFFQFFKKLIASKGNTTISISEELLILFEQISQGLTLHKDAIASNISDTDRKKILDHLGEAGSAYRQKIYSDKFSGHKAKAALSKVSAWIDTCNEYIERTIDNNKRPDGLYHAYNLMSTDRERVSISNLYEMLEGQVSVLSAKYLDSTEVLTVLDNLKASKMYREDQTSYVLYPNKDLPGFLEKNNIDEAHISRSKLLVKMIETDDHSIVSQDVFGGYHFNGDFRNANDLQARLEQIGKNYEAYTTEEHDLILQIFEDVFNHKAFTGRSGTFYGYEGLGSIYWHMVSKLRLAVLECCQDAIASKASQDIIDRLISHYYEIVAGLGVHKSPEVYGAFTTDAYSHTPGGKGAQQPGMTGQVKEDIICRFGELGMRIEHGTIQFKPDLLRKIEFITDPGTFSYIDIHGEEGLINLPEGALAFTLCQVPIIYRLAKERSIEIQMTNLDTIVVEGSTLDRKLSHQIFDRTGEVSAIIVDVKAHKLI